MGESKEIREWSLNILDFVLLVLVLLALTVPLAGASETAPLCWLLGPALQ